MASRENDFPRGVVEELRRRAGERCSVPWCDRITVGPSRLVAGSHSSGRAAHIYSAQSGGPRGQGGLTKAALRSYTNGLWCCERHADYIDTNNGNGLDAATLVAYRRLAETRALLANDGVRVPGAGWFDSVIIGEALPLAYPATMMFGKNTLLYGPNGSGKSVVADIVTGVGDARHWSLRTTTERRFRATVSLYDPEPTTFGIVLGGDDGGVTLTRNGMPALPVPGAAVIHWDKSVSRDSGTPLVAIGAALGVDPEVVHAALLSWRSPGLCGVRVRAHRRASDPDGLEFWMPHSPTSDLTTIPEHYYSYPMLSGTERLRLAIEVAVALAHENARRYPTLLVLNSLGQTFDTEWTRYLLELVASADNPFQTLVVSETSLDLPDAVGWTRAETIRLTTVETDPRRRTVFLLAQDRPLLDLP